MATTPLYCTNHPNLETLLRCNRCDRPFCVRCLVRTPVGYRCKECLNIQQAGFYTATAADYIMAGLVSFIASVVAGAVAVLVGGLFLLLEIFYAPVAGGAISEAVGRSIGRRRGRYIWLAACGMLIVGSAFGAMLYPFIAALFLGRGFSFVAILLSSTRALFNLGLLIYLALAIGTVYARLR